MSDHPRGNLIAYVRRQKGVYHFFLSVICSCECKPLPQADHPLDEFLIDGCHCPNGTVLVGRQFLHLLSKASLYWYGSWHPGTLGYHPSHGPAQLSIIATVKCHQTSEVPWQCLISQSHNQSHLIQMHPTCVQVQGMISGPLHSKHHEHSTNPS